MGKNREPRYMPSHIFDIYGQIIFDRGAKTVQWKKLYLKKIVLEKLDINVQKNELDSYFKICNKN